MKANVPTNPNLPRQSFMYKTVGDGNDGDSKILENEKFLRAWHYIYNACILHQIYVYHMNGCTNIKILVLYIVLYFHLI